MNKTYPELPKWEFELDEVSASVYDVVGTDKSGHRVSSKGTDLDALIEQCKKDAKEIEATLGTIDD